MHESGLVHVSRLADKFVRDPHDVVAVGDIVKVWVMEVDKERRAGVADDGPARQRAGAASAARRQARTRRPPAAAGASGGSAAGAASRPATTAAAGRRRSAAKTTAGPRPTAAQQYRPPPRPRPAPKPVIPITDAMKAGKEPMRTFGDLLQFYQQKPDTPADGKPPAAAETPPRPQAGEGPGVRAAAVEQPPVAVETAVEQPPAAETSPSPASGRGVGGEGGRH